MESGSLMKVERGAFCNAFNFHWVIIGIENQFLVFLLSARLRQVLLYTAKLTWKTYQGEDVLIVYLIPLL